MKKYILILAVFLCTASYAQEKRSPIQKSTVRVEGVCGMCKERIESAALRTKGVKTASWNKETKILSVVFNDKKTSLQTIQEAIADKGHTSEGAPVDSTNYAKLPDCCRYKDGAKCHD